MISVRSEVEDNVYEKTHHEMINYVDYIVLAQVGRAIEDQVMDQIKFSLQTHVSNQLVDDLFQLYLL